MLNIVNAKNYLTGIDLFWGSDSTDVDSTIGSNINFTHLIEDMVVGLDIYSSLSYPFFRGSVEYQDRRKDSLLRNLVDMPAIYGNLQFCMIDGSDVPGSDNIAKPVEGENMVEEIFVTKINTIDDGESEFVKFKIDFVSSDYLKFISNISGVSTYEGFEKNTKPMKELVQELFAAAGLADRLDVDSLTVDVEIPYVSSENDTLLTALDYVYRKIFDFDFKQHDGKTYCRLVYDQTKQKYVLWKFEDIGTMKSVDTELKNPEVKSTRERITVSSQTGDMKVGINSSAMVKTSGNQSVFFETAHNIKYIDYDYKNNVFTPLVKEKNDESFITHKDEFSGDLDIKMKLMLGNAAKFKENTYDRTYSTSRQNASPYDAYTSAIFDSSFIRAESDGSIGRHAGSQILLSFAESSGTMYESLGGDYLITAIHNKFTREENGVAFRSIMDLYRPYYMKDLGKTKIIT